MPLIYNQTWSYGSHEPAMKASGAYHAQTPWGSPNEAPDALYPDVIASERVQVNLGGGPNGENVVDVRVPDTLANREIAGIVVHPPTWPFIGDTTTTTSDRGTVRHWQYVDAAALGDPTGYWPIVSLASGLQALSFPHVEVAYTLGRLQMTLHNASPDIVYTGPLTTGWHQFALSWGRDSGVGDGLIQLTIDAEVRHSANWNWEPEHKFRAVWFGFAGLIGAVGPIYVYNDTTPTGGGPGGGVPGPSPTPTAPWTPCTPQSTVSNGGKGKSGCNTGGVGWISSYAGPYGSVPQHADPIDGELLDGNPTVDVWFDLAHLEYPTDDIVHYRRAHIDLGHVGTYEGGLKSEGLKAVGDIQHAISNEQGGLEAASVDIQYADSVDRLIRTTLADQELEGDEIAIKIASPRAVEEAADPRVVLRAVVQQTPTLSSPTEATITAVDSLFADYGPFGPQRTWPLRIPKLFLTAPPDTLSSDLPWLYGEKSDDGALDPLTGEPHSKGLCPLIYAGQEVTGTTPVSNMPTAEGADALGTFGVLGWSAGSGWVSDGTVTDDPYHYVFRVTGSAASFLGGGRSATPSPDGTVYGFRVVWNDPNPVAPDYYLVFEVPAPYSAWRPFSNPAPSGVNVRVQTVAAAPTNDLPDWEHGPVFWGQPTDGLTWPLEVTEIADVWDVYIAFGHPVFRILSLYASNLGHGNPEETPDRELIDLAARGGVDVLVPGHPGWPFAETYREYTDTDGTVYWLTVIYAKGPISDDHKSGRVTMAVNAIGVEDVGDGTGLPLIDAEDCKQHWLENAILNRWTSGLWTDELFYPAWEDGTPKVRTSSFLARKTYQATNYGGRGLTVGWYVEKSAVLTEFVREWNLLESPLGVNGHGQFISFGIDEYEDTSTWSRLDHVSGLFGPVRRLAGVQRENEVSGVCDWDPDLDRFRASEVTVTDEIAVAKNKHRKKHGNVITSRILNQTPQVLWVIGKRLQRLSLGMALQEVTGPIGLLDYDVGQGRQLTTPEGLGPDGFTDRAMLITRRRISLTASPIAVSYTLWDVSSLFYVGLLPAGAQQLPFVTNTGSGTKMMVTNDLDLAPAVLP